MWSKISFYSSKSQRVNELLHDYSHKDDVKNEQKNYYSFSCLFTFYR